MSNEQYFPQVAGSVVAYKTNEYATTCQITVGGRVTGNVTVKYRPYLHSKPEAVNISDYDIPLVHQLKFAVQGDGSLVRTLLIEDIRVTHILIDDTAGVGDFWVHIVQF